MLFVFDIVMPGMKTVGELLRFESEWCDNPITTGCMSNWHY